MVDHPIPRPVPSLARPSIIIDGQHVEVPFPTNLDRMGQLSTRARRGTVVQVILHHDVCLSAARCFTALKMQGFSTHFCIDNDGTCWQFADPAREVAFHAIGQVLTGGPGTASIPTAFNNHSIGIDISNAVLLKYASRYDPPREQATLPVQRIQYTGLMPYPVQVETALELLRTLRAHFPSVTNAHRDELRWKGDLTSETPGVWGHAQISNQKVDPFGFPFPRLSEV